MMRPPPLAFWWAYRSSIRQHGQGWRNLLEYYGVLIINQYVITYGVAIMWYLQHQICRIVGYLPKKENLLIKYECAASEG
jgi:hypothetical protein